MNIHLILLLVLIPFGLINMSTNLLLVTSECLGDQQSLLLNLRSELSFGFGVKLKQWSRSADCCQWNGVTCNEGLVTGLDLSQEFIYGGIGNSSSLFSLQSLQTLNLAHNNITSAIPSGFHKLKNLRHLNLSHAGFWGQIPIQISQLTRLLTLDLSADYYLGLRLENPNLLTFIQNLTEVTELYLDGVHISAHKNQWCHALSSSLPRLQILSLACCNLQGPIHSSLTRLQSLSMIRLSQNQFLSPVPEFIANFKNLTILDLRDCGLHGRFPEKILQLERLNAVDISYNYNLHGCLPNFPQNGPLQTLKVYMTKFSGPLPSSISNLRQLSTLDLSFCQFNGTLPSSLSKLNQLAYLDLSYNKFTGPIPSLSMLKNLAHLDLSGNGFNGAIPPAYFQGLLNLVHIYLKHNSFNGRIPTSMFVLPSVQKILLQNNQFDGQIDEFINASSELQELDLSHNCLEGPIPLSLFQLTGLRYLRLPFNNFSGKIELNLIRRLGNLNALDLSNNNLSISNAITMDSSLPSFPSLSSLSLASCGLTTFPEFLKNQSKLSYLDLSNNHIQGIIPLWIWNMTLLQHINMSQNYLTDFKEPPQSLPLPPSLMAIDLHNNLLQRQLPFHPQELAYLDYSSNNLSSIIPPNIGNQLPTVAFLSFSRNNIHGSIPKSICKSQYLEVLDLSDNSLTGTIPKCLITMKRTLTVLNLSRNKLTGNIHTSAGSCNLRTLDLSGNFLEGKLPKFLVHCTTLEVLNFGNNQIDDNFPCWLKTISNLRVLVLRSNKLHGSIRCPSSTHSVWSDLQILDLGSNNFSGRISPAFFKSFKAMAIKSNEKLSQQNHLQFEVQGANILYPDTVSKDPYYQYKVTATFKYQNLQFDKILTVFASIDLSCNKFEGPIPEELGQLKALYMLNLSHNVFSGHIPSSIGNLQELESLDLSNNSFSGEIPIQLASISFLSVLNLSFNHLEGRIPTGSQLQSFEASSFIGNRGLCGPPLTQGCGDDEVQGKNASISGNSHSVTDSLIDRNFISAELGFSFGIGMVILLLVFWTKGRLWHWEQVDRIL